MRLTAILSITALFLISAASTNIYAQKEPTNFVALFQKETAPSLCYKDLAVPYHNSDAYYEVLYARDWVQSEGRECFQFRGIRPYFAIEDSDTILRCSDGCSGYPLVD
jgi:hypothetical protein